MSHEDDDYEEEAYHIDDDDGGIESDSDICDRCECTRGDHEGGTGPCDACGRCRKFKES